MKFTSIQRSLVCEHTTGCCFYSFIANRPIGHRLFAWNTNIFLHLLLLCHLWLKELHSNSKSTWSLLFTYWVTQIVSSPSLQYYVSDGIRDGRSYERWTNDVWRGGAGGLAIDKCGDNPPFFPSEIYKNGSNNHPLVYKPWLEIYIKWEKSISTSFLQPQLLPSGGLQEFKAHLHWLRSSNPEGGQCWDSPLELCSMMAKALLLTTAIRKWLENGFHCF